MESSSVKAFISVLAGIAALLAALVTSNMIDVTKYHQRSYIFIIIIAMTLISYIISILFTFISYALSQEKSSISIGYVFLKALYSPLMTFLMLFLFAGLPVLFGILPNKYQKVPGESMNFFGGFRGIPESMSNKVGPQAPPIAEMFYAFWGALYGQSLASAGF